MQAANITPIPISTLKPSDEEIAKIRADTRDEFADGVGFADLVEALDGSLGDKEQLVLLERVKKARIQMNAGDGISLVDALAIAGFVSAAFDAHVCRWAESNVNAYVDGYADSMAEELREKGRLVDASC